MKFNKKVIIWSIVFFFVGFIISPSEITETIEKEVIKTVTVESECLQSVECPVQENIECPINNSEKLISLYEQVLELDGQAFTIAADNMLLIHTAAEAGVNRDIAEIERIVNLMDYSTDKINKIANNKHVLLEKIENLK